MITHSYEFAPGERVYVVIDESCVKEATVLQYTFDTYMTEIEPTDVEKYLVKYANEDMTAIVLPENIFSTADEALAQIDLNLMGDLSL
jgi:hypothetical protein